MDNFRDSYFPVDWDLTSRRLRGTFWGKQYDTGRGFAVTVINGGQVVTATNEVLRLKWEKPDQTTGYVNATIVDGKFIVENIDQMFTVQGRVRADFELSVGGESLASVTFYVSVEKAVAVDAIESSSDFSAFQQSVADFSTAIAAVTPMSEEIIAARDGEPNLKSRLDKEKQEVTAQLAHKAERAEAYLRNTGLSLNDFKEEDRQAILETNNIDINYVLGEKNVKAINVDDNTLVPSNTTFIKGGGGINLFNGIYVTARLTGSTGFTFRNTSGGLGYIVEVEPNTDYNVYRSMDSDAFRLTVFDDYPTDGMVGIARRETVGADRLTISTGETGKFLVAYVATAGSNPPSEFQITKGSDAKPYISPNEKIIIDIDKKSLPPIDVEMTNFSKRSKNLFNGEYQDNRFITNSGVFVVGSSHGYPNARTTKAIECVGGENYVLSGEYDRYRWRFEDNNGEFVGTVNSTQVTAPENASHMYVYYSSSGEHKKLQIEQGEQPTKYSAYFVIDEEFLPESESDSLVLLGDDFSRYNVVEPYLTETPDFDNVYNLIDDLMNDFPQYVSKSEVARTDLGTPIYRYDIQTPNTKTLPSNKLKIYLNGGTHGDERRALYGTIRFISDLLKQWKEQKSLQFLLSNIHLIYIPTLNPDGLTAGTRVNGNGVDINRNFPTDWTYNPDKESNNYTGESPASEIETNVMMNIIAENPDLYFAIDYHNYATLETAGTVSWVGADNQLTQKIIRAWGQNYDGEIRLFSPILENHESNLVSIRDKSSLGTYNGGTSRFMESKGINAVTLEAVWSYGSTIQDGQSLNADIIGNFLLGMVRSYRELS